MSMMSKLTIAFYNLIGRRRCSAVCRINFTEFNFNAYTRFYVKVLIATNVNVSNELNFSDI